MITKTGNLQNSPNFGWIRLPRIGTPGYKNLINRLEAEEMKELDELVSKYSSIPIEAEISGFENSNLLSAKIKLGKVINQAKDIIKNETQTSYKISSPLKFLDYVGKITENMWESLANNKQIK